ncbi:LLM class flavin-dependent oxidoreductase [Actinoplanes sp. NPDC051411]|uniref:LLM class flavin-dependent oxidoreductase n=1 Tax=Actinoplanes sp. NPDC051411 TaxID=3155522 RepID=UPI00343EA71F
MSAQGGREDGAGMEVGIGIPNTVPGVSGNELVSWAAEAEQAGFSTLATLDRLVYDNYESLTVLAAAAAVTSRVKLMTGILIAPLHTNAALLAKQVATVDRLSDGRLALGLAVGSRPDDFAASGTPHAGRGSRLDAQIDELRRLWAGERRGFAGGVGPTPTRHGGPPMVFGGHSPAAIRRAANSGSGWISGSGGLGMFRKGSGAVRAEWARAGRDGRPRTYALVYFSLGDRADELANAYLRDYYGFAPPYAQAVVNAAAIGADAVRQTVRDFAAAGCDELIMAPCSADPDQIKLLSEAVADAR